MFQLFLILQNVCKKTGENGSAVNLSHLDQNEIDKAVGMYGYNRIASDMISLDRHINDYRNKE